MNKQTLHIDTPVSYRPKWCFKEVTIFGKVIGGVVPDFHVDSGHTQWQFVPMDGRAVYYGPTIDSAVLNYLAHQYGGGLDA